MNYRKYKKPMQGESVDTNKRPNIMSKRNCKRMCTVSLVLLVLIFVAMTFFLFHHFIKTRVKDDIKSNLDALLVVREVETENDVGTQIANELLDDVFYEIMSIQGNTAVVSITAPNIHDLYIRVLQEQGDIVPSNVEEYENLMESTLQKLNEELEKQNYDKQISEITVHLIEDGSIEMSYELIDALYGGLLTLQKELVDGYIGE